MSLAILATTVALMLLSAVIVHTRSYRYGALSGSIINPLFLFVAVIFIFYIDFAVLLSALDGGAESPTLRGTIVSGTNAAYGGLLLLSSATIFSCLGILAAKHLGLRATPTKTEAPLGSERFLSTFNLLSLLVLLASAVAAASLVASAGGNLSMALARRQIFFADKQVLSLILALNLPAAIFQISRSTGFFSRSTLFVLSHCAFLFFLGSRGIFLYLCFAIAVHLSFSGRHLKQYTILFLAPAAFVFLSFFRIFLRNEQVPNSLTELLISDGGLFSNLFNSIEISVAEIISIIYSNPTIVDRYPFESILGLVVYLLPRATFTWKPTGASAAFSEALNPDHWYLFRSESVITGISDFYLMFGYFFVFAFFLFGFLIQRLTQLVVSLPKGTNVVASTYLCINIFVFLRSDVFNMSSNLWALALYLLMLFSLRLLFWPRGPTST